MMASSTMDEGQDAFVDNGGGGDDRELPCGPPFPGNDHDCSHSSNESGIDETEFKTNREESAKLFCRNEETDEERTAFSLQDLFSTLNAKKAIRSSLVSHVELEVDTKRLSLKVDRTNIRAKYGYDLGRLAYLYPEEALYLLDVGKIEIFCGHVSLSVQRARSLLLVPQRRDGEDRFTHCTTDEYLVYKHLTRSNYALYRFNKSLNGAPSSTVSGDNVDEIMAEETEEDGSTQMEEDDDDIIEVESSSSRPNLKRKLASSSGSESEEGLLDDVDEVMDDSNEIYASGISFGSSVANFSSGAASGYMVDEASDSDSDVEIVDEVIYRHGGVEIQEISHCVGVPEENPGEPVPSTSRGPDPDLDTSQVLVDLVSSDDEEAQDLYGFGKRVWSKFIPNVKVIFEFPPPSLIPDSIPASDKIYELDLKDKSDVSDLELEFLVDEVSLNDDDHGMSSSLAKSWKEWRQNMFREARDVMNDSLLASTDYIKGEAVTEKLCRWNETQNDGKSSDPCNSSNVVFEMYGPIGTGFSRLKAYEGSPRYYVSITRQDERIPDFGLFGSSIDGVPILIAVVCDNGDNEVV